VLQRAGYVHALRVGNRNGGEASGGAIPEPSTVPYTTVTPHLNPLTSRAALARALARDRPRESRVWITEVTVARLRDRVCDGGCARPAAPQAQR
jgi:hypothetical protein